MPAPRTRLIANYGVGVNHIDLAAAQRAGVLVTNTPGVLTEATAELAITLMLAVARRISEGERLVRSGRWTGWAPTQLLGTGLTGRTLGIVGMGRIGAATARRAARGLGMKVRYYSRSEAPAERLGGVHAVRDDALESLLECADVVSLHCPLTPATRHLINAEGLAVMPRHALLINTARGEVVDEQALADAIASGSIAGCGLDVHEHEPAVHPALAASERAVLLPHLGSATAEAREAMGELVLRNIEAFARGDPPPNLVS
jgi:lactate dehydrogenase-like 2-hydroxyacid dehydrogenase